MVEQGLREHIRLFTYQPVHASNLERLAGLGLQTTLLPHADAVPAFVPGDVVLLNTTGFSPAVKEAVFAALDRGVVKRMFWYVHEDAPERIFTAAETVADPPAERRGQARDRHALAAGPREVPPALRDGDPPRAASRRPARRSTTASGSPATSRRSASSCPARSSTAARGSTPSSTPWRPSTGNHFRREPSSYREFTLTFVGVEDDWYSRQVVRHRHILGDRVIIHPKMTREPCLDLIREANVTICYSQSETLPIFVVEGMLAGHPILRNDCSGAEEQLEDGRNGFLLDTEDFWQVVETFERILNRRQDHQRTARRHVGPFPRDRPGPAGEPLRGPDRPGDPIGVPGRRDVPVSSPLLQRPSRRGRFPGRKCPHTSPPPADLFIVAPTRRWQSSGARGSSWRRRLRIGPVPRGGTAPATRSA